MLQSSFEWVFACPANILILMNATLNSHLNILQWLKDNIYSWQYNTCAYAAKLGHLSLLQFARKNGCPWTKNTCALAATNGHFNIIKWAKTNGCEWDKETCSNASKHGHLNILKWARGMVATGMNLLAVTRQKMVI